MMQLRSKRPPETPEDAAIWWATRRQVDPVNFANDDGFATWLADDAHAKAWEEVERRVGMIGSYATMPEIREMRLAALALARDQAPPRRRWVLGGAIAASLLGVALWTGLPNAGPLDQPAATDVAQRFATGIGQRRDVVLADGSKVTLNTASLIEVRYTADLRDVRLLQGQAMFHVAKDSGRPFVVSARNRQVTALGTAFDVRIRQDGNVQVLLVEGRVQVDPLRRQGLARLIPALARTELSPGQQLVTEGPSAAEVSSADVERETAWNRGILLFRADSLSDAVKEVNRYSAMPLIIDDPQVGELKVSGIFPVASQNDFIAALETLYPVQADAEPGGTIRLRWRDDGKRQPH